MTNSSMSVAATFIASSPPDGDFPLPPVTTRAQSLPFGELTWENFERLCHRLVALKGEIEYCNRYGRQGDPQQGIDIYARQSSGRYICLQAKRHSSFNAAQIGDAVDMFLNGHWASRSESFILAVQSSLRSVSVQDAIEEKSVDLRARGITFLAYDGEDLTNQLRDYPEIIDDFFGRAWVAALLGEESARGLKSRLDGGTFSKARKQLSRVYQTSFQFVDPGSFGSISEEEGRPELTLLERFLKPDILVREIANPLERVDSDASNVPKEQWISSSNAEAVERLPINPTSSSGMRRLQLHEWIGEAQRLVLLGDAGSGKSTLLRVIALDLLQDQVYFPELASRWGQLLPIYIPFARWATQAASVGGVVGIRDIVRQSLEPLLTESLADLMDQAIETKRLLLLVDGLDEWSSEQAARTTLSALVTSVEAYGIPVIVSGRRRGLEKIGALPFEWRRGTVAPLSVSQQSSIASRWFSRFSSTQVVSAEASSGSLRTRRFMAELARDSNLSALATTPLLLIGLVILALRGQILPRSRSDIYDQLVRVLLEVHPSRRATAAGDTELRFKHATDSEQRRAAIACLAFVVRDKAGGAGIDQATALETLKAFLNSPAGFDLDNNLATKAAGEILSVNSETQGLIVEKGPGEIGFVHASFEEYLGAEHIGGWPFERISTFVRAHAGEARWRNVITNLLGYIQRRDEVDCLVSIIEEPCADELSQLNRQALLGDIAFAVSNKATVTARRLAHITMQRVESEDWLPARREALSSVLKGLSDPTLKSEIEKRLTQWLPARLRWRTTLIKALELWEPNLQLQDMLIRAMHDDDSNLRFESAKVYAKLFDNSEAAANRLIQGLARSRDLKASAALLMGLAYGWHEMPAAHAIFKNAFDYHRGELRLAGMFGLLFNGARTSEMRDLALRSQSVWSGISYAYQDQAEKILITYWPNDSELIKSAIQRVTDRYEYSPWEYSSASMYLISCDIGQPEVYEWVIEEFKKDYPFNFRPDGNLLWERIGQFAQTSPQVRDAVNNYWTKKENWLLNSYRLPTYVRYLADPVIKDFLCDKLTKGDGSSIDRLWAIRALLTGWGTDDTDIQVAVNQLKNLHDDDLKELVVVLPKLYADKSMVRERLLRLCTNYKVRFDLLVIGFSECGCDSLDEVVMQSLLKRLRENRELPGMLHPLFEKFGDHSEVREIALQSARSANETLPVIAASYVNDLDFFQILVDAAVPLPTDLRAQIIELAVDGAAGTVLENVLSQAMLESDSELRVRMAIAHYGRVASESRAAAIQELSKRAVAVGFDFESERAAALAGMIAVGALSELNQLKEHGEPLKLEIGSLYGSSSSLKRQICERFADFEHIFGEELAERFRSFGSSDRLPDILAAAPGSSPAARSAFLKMAESGALNKDIKSIRALAAERPRSDALIKLCWDVLEKTDYGNNKASNNAEIAIILREQFPNDIGVQERLSSIYKKSPSNVTAVTLAVYSPSAMIIPSPSIEELGQDFCDWTIALHISAFRSDSNEFLTLLEAMLTSKFIRIFEAQKITNLAVLERLRRDPELEMLLCSKLRSDVDRSIYGSFARYLAAAGKFDQGVREAVTGLLRITAEGQSLPLAGYDAIADEWRCTRSTLLDALSAGLELS